MSIRRPALLLASAILITACSDAPPATGPAPALSRPTLAIDAGTACTGATMPVIECQALVVLYNTTGGPAWTTNDRCGVNPNPCNWSGVECTGGDNGSVRRKKSAIAARLRSASSREASVIETLAPPCAGACDVLVVSARGSEPSARAVARPSRSPGLCAIRATATMK